MHGDVFILLVEAIGAYLLVLWAHALRPRLGLGPFYALLGGLTALMSWLTDVGLRVEVAGLTFMVGSTVFYTALLLGVFVIYVFDGPQPARTAILAVVALSILTPLVALVLHTQADLMGLSLLIPTPGLRVNVASVCATVADLVFLAMAWEFLGRPGLHLRMWQRTFLTLLGVMWLDVLLFSTGAFAGTPAYLNIMSGNLISRLAVTLLATPLLSLYLQRQHTKPGMQIEQRPVLAILREMSATQAELAVAREEIARRREAETRLRESEAKFRSLYETMTEGVALHRLVRAADGTPADYVLLSVNPAFERILGVAPGAAVGHAATEVFGAAPPPYLETYAAVATTGRATQFDTYFKPMGKWFSISCFAPGPDQFATVFEDITDRKRSELEREATMEFLRLVNENQDLATLVHKATLFFKAKSGCDAVGIRLREGDDYPYYEARGFPPEFQRLENSLCCRDADGKPLRDDAGRPILECMCGNVIRGRTDACQPFFTPHGSFWSNNTTRLLAETIPAERQAVTRNRCNGWGYESVALLPLRFGAQSFGLLQFNHRAPDAFTAPMIALWERLADHLAVAVSRARAQESLRANEATYRSLFEHMLNGFAYCRMELAPDGAADFVFVSVNQAFETHTGLAQVVGRRASEVMPGLREKDAAFVALCRRVVETGVPAVGEHYLQSLRLWFHVAAYCPQRQHLVLVFDVVNARKQSESERERLMAAIEQSNEVVVITDTTGAIQYVNPAFTRTTGYTREEALGATPRILQSGRQDAAFYRDLWARLARGQVWTGRFINKRKNGEHYTEEATISPVRDATGRLVNFVAVKRDISAELLLEAKLLQAQKMESVGRLAGGVAHDYNNMLGVILGCSELALSEMGEADPLREHIEEIRKAARRSADITRQLLAFARKQTIAPRVLELNETIEGMLKMLRHLIGENIELVWRPAGGRLAVKMDPSQLDQILANLAVNARDAIRGVGKIVIETAGRVFSAADLSASPDLAPGAYVMLLVSDTGCGMDPETLAHIFEPFFTTKPVGAGTGLGLATVYGIVKQNNGFITTVSQPGAGATFRLYLPRHAAADAPAPTNGPTTCPRGAETILVVEDEQAVRLMVRRFLAPLGYDILLASGPADALRLAGEHTAPIHLLVTDLVMPGMSGRDLAGRLCAARPDLRCLYISGYPADVIAEHGIIDEQVAFLPKPFTQRELARKVREALDR